MRQAMQQASPAKHGRSAGVPVRAISEGQIMSYNATSYDETVRDVIPILGTNIPTLTLKDVFGYTRYGNAYQVEEAVEFNRGYQ